MIGPSHILNENGDLSFLLYFSKQCLVENIQGKLKIEFASTGDCLELFASEGNFEFQRIIIVNLLFPKALEITQEHLRGGSWLGGLGG